MDTKAPPADWIFHCKIFDDPRMKVGWCRDNRRRPEFGGAEECGPCLQWHAMEHGRCEMRKSKNWKNSAEGETYRRKRFIAQEQEKTILNIMKSSDQEFTSIQIRILTGFKIDRVREYMKKLRQAGKIVTGSHKHSVRYAGKEEE